MNPTAHNWLLSGILLSLAVFCANLGALPDDRKQPIHITSNSFKHDGKTGETMYTGDVYLTQGSIKLTAENIIMRSTPEGELISIIAKGNPADFEQKPKADKPKIVGNAKTITYTTASNSVTLVGNAQIKQGKQMKMNSEFIEYLADTEQVKANTSNGSGSDIKSESSRVNIIIPPRNNKI